MARFSGFSLSVLVSVLFVVVVNAQSAVPTNYQCPDPVSFAYIFSLYAYAADVVDAPETSPSD